MPRRRPPSALPRLAFALLTGAVAACAAAPTGPASGRLALVNTTSDTLGYGAVELETSHRIDPNPEFAAAGLGDRVVGPGATAAVPVEQIDGYRPGASVRFFIWGVRAGRARLRGLVTVSGADLARRRYRVEVTSAALGPAQP